MNNLDFIRDETDYYKVNHSDFLTEDRLVDSRARLDMLRKIIGGFVQPFPVCQGIFLHVVT